MTQKSLLKIGIIGMRSGPSRLVTTIVTYKHPTVPGLTVTVHPVPTLAGPQFWLNHWFDLHKKYDRIIVEDGWLPVRSNTAAGTYSRIMRYAMPYMGHHMTADNDVELGKYEAPQNFRDRYDSAVAYMSVVQLSDPPTDPRSRRAVDRLNVVAEGMQAGNLASTPHRVAMPYGVYHCYYLNWRFNSEGWTVERTEEVEYIRQSQIAMIMILNVALFMYASYWVFSGVLGALFW